MALTPDELRKLAEDLKRSTTNRKVVDLCDGVEELLRMKPKVVKQSRRDFMRGYMKGWRKDHPDYYRMKKGG